MLRLLVCVGGCCAGDVYRPDARRDGSYQEEPLLEQAAVACESGQLVVRARIRGWSESAFVDLWRDPANPTQDGHFGFSLPTVAFARDESCDLVEGPCDPGVDAGCAVDAGDEDPPTGVSCEELLGYTMFVQATFEEGCAGCALSGDAAAAAAVAADAAHTHDTKECDVTPGADLCGQPLEDLAPFVAMEEIEPCG